MRRIVVDLPDEHIKALDMLKILLDIPRAELIRQAVDRFLLENEPDNGEAFGLWKNKADAMEYQNPLREEWE